MSARCTGICTKRGDEHLNFEAEEVISLLGIVMS